MVDPVAAVSRGDMTRDALKDIIAFALSYAPRFRMRCFDVGKFFFMPLFALSSVSVIFVFFPQLSLSVIVFYFFSLSFSEPRYASSGQFSDLYFSVNVFC